MTKITTFSGRTIYLASPSHKDIDIGDIAHALSLLCRFNGHCREFYSVAEHSVRVSLLLEDLAKQYDHAKHTRKLCLMGLLHDAAEAYPPGDIAGPLKQLLKDEYGEDGLSSIDVQNRFDKAVRAHFDLNEPFDNAWTLVDLADRMLLAWEWRDIMGRPAKDKPDGIGSPHTEKQIQPWSDIAAEVEFLTRFQQLAPAYPLHSALRRLVPQARPGYNKGWRTQLHALVLAESDRATDAAMPMVVLTSETKPATPTPALEKMAIGLVKDREAIPMVSRDQQTTKKKKRKKKRKKHVGFSADEVERMIAQAVEAQTVNKMSAPKRGAPGSSPDDAQPVPVSKPISTTAAERAAMADPDVRDKQAEKVKGGRGLGSAAYDD